jgi:hypothetical protein
MNWAIQTWADVGSVATVVTAGIALLSAGFALGQISAQARVAREVKAIEAWDGYLRLCVEKPELSSSATFFRTYSRYPNVDYTQNSKEDEQYLWFVSALLNAGEQILLNAPEGREWKAAIKDQVGFHEPVLKQVWYGRRKPEPALDAWFPYYSKRMQQIVRNVVGPSLEVV